MLLGRITQPGFQLAVEFVLRREERDADAFAGWRRRLACRERHKYDRESSQLGLLQQVDFGYRRSADGECFDFPGAEGDGVRPFEPLARECRVGCLAGRFP